MSEMPSKSLKQLYIAKSWEELKKKGDETTQKITIKSNTIDHLVKSADKLYSAAKASDIDGDEERCYILFFRFSDIIFSINKSNISQKDKDFVVNLNKSRLKEAILSLEVLETSLKNRYSVLKESQEFRAKEIAESNDKNVSNKSINDSNYSKQNEVNDNSYPLIDCQLIVEELENSTEMTRILIFDSRDTIDYNESHIDKIKTTADLTVAHIPKELLTPGLTASKLEKILPLGNITDVFSRRRQMSKVIILDDFSTELIPGTPAYNLAEAIWKWDTSSLKVKTKPFLLKGGYDEWVLKYPVYTSNPNYGIKSNNLSFNRRQTNLVVNYDFSDLENDNKKVDNHLANGLPNGQIKDKEQVLDNNSDANNRLNVMFQNPRPSKSAVPGTAQLASNMPSIPDRSTKPKIQIESKNTFEKPIEPKEDIEKFKLRKQYEATEEMLSSIKNQYQETTQTFLEQIKQKDEENLKLKSLIRKSLPEKPSNVQNNGSNDETNVKQNNITNGEINSVDKRNGIHLIVNEMGDDNKENNEIHIRNSISMNGDIGNETPNRPTTGPKTIMRTANNLSVNSNLSRSLSSPNIAQLLAKELNEKHFDDINGIESKERSLTNPSQPQIDRTLKPTFNRVTFNDNKLRDFCPVHSAGNSITGLRNLGNTCFMNAVIQCLSNTTEFSTFFVNGLFHINKNSKFGSNGELVMELSALFRAMAYPSTYKSISPKDFKQSVSKHIQGFIGFSQQDSHEFLLMLIEKLHADLNESTIRDVIDTSVPEELSLTVAANKFWKEHINKNKSIITQLFEGLIVNTLMCLTCQKTSITFEVFRCLSLPLSNSRTTLNECLNQFFKPERLSGEAAWECPTCKTKREAEKKVVVWKLPKILIVHLKRFLYEGVWRQKNQTYVEFPIEELPMRCLTNETKYNLYGVVNHYGTLEGGHYTAYSKNPNKYKWHRFDDQEITSINAADVKTQAAYILFYKSW